MHYFSKLEFEIVQCNSQSCKQSIKLNDLHDYAESNTSRYILYDSNYTR